MTLELEPYWDTTPKRKPSPRRDDCCCYFCSVPTSCLILCNSIDCSCQAPVFSALSWTFLLRFMSIESVMLSNHLILSHSLLFLPSIFPSIRVFASGGPSIGASASTLPMNIQGWFPLGLTGFISWLFRGLSRVFSNTTVGKHQFFGAQPSLWSNSHIHMWILEKL